MFSGLPTHNGGDYVYLSIGYIDSTYQTGRVAVRLPGLYNSSQYDSVSANHITSVKFYCFDTSGNGTYFVNLNPITGPAWTESETSWSQAHTRATSFNCGAYMANALGDYGVISSSNITLMNNELTAGRWVVACLKPTYGMNGHVIVIQSYSATNETYTCWDPWTNSTMTFSREHLENSAIKNPIDGSTCYLCYFVNCKP